MLVEKIFLSKILEKTPKVLRHVYVMLILFVSWAFFDALEFSTAFTTIGRMFGSGVSEFAGREALYYLRSYALPFIVGIIGVTPLVKKLGSRFSEQKLRTTVLEPVALLLIMTATTASMVDGSFNPFIYFRF